MFNIAGMKKACIWVTLNCDRIATNQKPNVIVFQHKLISYFILLDQGLFVSSEQNFLHKY